MWALEILGQEVRYFIASPLCLAEGHREPLDGVAPIADG